MRPPKGLTLAASIATLASVVALIYLSAAGPFSGEGRPPEVHVVDHRAMPTRTESAGEHPGEVIYTRLCQACHGSGAAGAPLLGRKDAWEPRIAQGMNALLQTVIAGKGAMPPRGTCRDCSDADLEAAIAYMVSRAK